MKYIVIFLLFIQASFAQTFNVTVVGESYGRNEKELFLSDLENIKSELFLRLWQRKAQFNFMPLSHQNKFQCKESGFFDGGTCTDTKVVSEVRSFNLTVPINGYLVISKNLCGGGGGAVCLAGACFHNTENSGQIGVHELGHSLFGLQHLGSIFMSSSCNHGACAQLATFNPSEFAIINTELNRKAGIFSTPQPTLEILNPVPNNTATAGSTYKIEVKLTGSVQQVEVIYDGVSKGVFMCWERGYNCKPNSMVYWLNMPTAGQYVLTITATDINGQTATQSQTINVQ